MNTLLGSGLPVAAAPLAGGPTTVDLARAAADAGAFAFMPAGYKTAAQLDDDLAAMEGLGRPFGVNLFVPQPDHLDRAAFRAYAQEISPEADALGVTVASDPTHDDDEWAAKVDLLLHRPVAVVSLTFGLPEASSIADLQKVGSRVLATVTTVEEARTAHAAGVDGLVVQGPGAGGHSATFDPRRPVTGSSTVEVVTDVRGATGLPVVAAGGVDGPASVRLLLDAGAESVAVGTLLLRSHESGASRTHQDALADPAFTETVVTHCFTGRPARALRNGFYERHHAGAPYGYPDLHHLTRDLRRAAAASGDPHRLHLWAGTGYRSARVAPAAEILTDLMS